MKDKPKEDTPPVPPIVENLFAAEVYADAAAFFSHKGPNVSITFTSTRFDNSVAPGAAKNIVIGRLVMPAHAAQNLAVGLFDYLKKLGLDPAQTGGAAN